MYNDIYLSFPDEATAKAVLYRIEGAVEANEEMGIEAHEGEEVANYANIDIIGTIYKPTGQMIAGEDGEYPEMAAIEGWHVNVRLAKDEDGTPLEAYAVNVATPMRVWG